jgi:hypothetical protein
LAVLAIFAFKTFDSPLRLLRKPPVLSGAIVLTLALGIGLDAGVFNLIDGMLFRARVEHDPDAFVQVGVEYFGPNAPRSSRSVYYPDLKLVEPLVFVCRGRVSAGRQPVPRPGPLRRYRKVVAVPSVIAIQSN